MPEYNPWGTPMFPQGAAFGTGSPEEDAQRRPSIVDNLVSQIAGALGRGFMAPGNAYNSPTPLTSEQLVAPAHDMMGVMASGGMPMAERGAVGIFGGKLAQTADQGALAKAEQLHAAGAPREQIWNETGWFKGADDKWRFEIPDNIAHFKGTGSIGDLVGNRGPFTKDVFAHPDLYAAYPELKNIEVSPSNIKGMGGSFNPGEPALEFNPYISLNNSILGDKRTAVMLHELQHAVQSAEGFAAGGNKYALSPGTRAWDIYQERLAAIRSPLSHEDFSKQAGYDAPTKDYQDYLKQVRNPSPMVDRAAQDYAVEQAYRRAAGEVEARNVEGRMNLNNRAATPPWATQDVPDANQIVRFRLPPLK